MPHVEWLKNSGKYIKPYVSIILNINLLAEAPFANLFHQICGIHVELEWIYLLRINRHWLQRLMQCQWQHQQQPSWARNCYTWKHRTETITINNIGTIATESRCIDVNVLSLHMNAIGVTHAKDHINRLLNLTECNSSPSNRVWHMCWQIPEMTCNSSMKLSQKQNPHQKWAHRFLMVKS